MKNSDATLQIFPDLPDCALDAGPDRAFNPLRYADVAPVQLGVGDFILTLGGGANLIFGARHHNGQRALIWLKLHHMELLLVSQHLMSFLEFGKRQEDAVRKQEKKVSSFFYSNFYIWMKQTITSTSWQWEYFLVRSNYQLKEGDRLYQKGVFTQRWIWQFTCSKCFLPTKAVWLRLRFLSGVNLLI